MTKKRYQGTSNDKARSTQKLIDAVGKIIKTKGYIGLTATNISKAAGLSRRLITSYFGSFDGDLCQREGLLAGRFWKCR